MKHVQGTSGDMLLFVTQEEDRVVVIRFGHDWEENCMQMDQVRPFRRTTHTAVHLLGFTSKSHILQCICRADRFP